MEGLRIHLLLKTAGVVEVLGLEQAGLEVMGIMAEVGWVEVEQVEEELGERVRVQAHRTGKRAGLGFPITTEAYCCLVAVEEGVEMEEQEGLRRMAEERETTLIWEVWEFQIREAVEEERTTGWVEQEGRAYLLFVLHK